jgi:hypothetical protein
LPRLDAILLAQLSGKNDLAFGGNLGGHISKIASYFGRVKLERGEACQCLLHYDGG